MGKRHEQGKRHSAQKNPERPKSHELLFGLFQLTRNEIQIATTRCHFMPVELTKIKMPDHLTCEGDRKFVFLGPIGIAKPLSEMVVPVVISVSISSI